MTQISTSTTATATAYPNQRKIDRTSNGVLWAAYVNQSSNMVLYYSLDNGTTWTLGDTESSLVGTGGPQVVNFSMFIDADDYLHLAFKSYADGLIYYRRGTPNAGRTAWTWSTESSVIGPTNSYDYPDIVAHREGTGWTVHAVMAYVSGTTTSRTYYRKMNITSSGSFSSWVNTTLADYSYPSATNTYPSIDFNHTGDGKTVKDGTPHIYVAWTSKTSVGIGPGVYFSKATYSGGTWSWPASASQILAGPYVPDGGGISCMFDGTRVMIAGTVLDTSWRTIVCERDAADTTTTIHVNTVPAEADRLIDASASYDSDGNIYIVGASQNISPMATNLYKWTRGTGVSENSKAGYSTLPSTSRGRFSMKRGYSGGLIEFINMDGSSSPYSVNYGFTTPIQPTYVWDGTTRQSATIRGVWNGTDVTPVKAPYLWSPYTANYEGVY